MTASPVRILAIVVALGLAVPVLAQQATQREIEESLTCQCGSGEPIKKEIAERLARGESKDQILDAFTQKFGEKVLSSPTFAGFNWLAWVTPFAALLMAGTVLTVVIRKRAIATAAASGPVPTDRPPAGTDALRARLARELDDLEREQ